MLNHEFTEIISKFMSDYKREYNNSQIRVLMGYTKDLTPVDFRNILDQMYLDHITLPPPKQIAKEISKYRERRRGRERTQEANDALRFWRSPLSDDEKRMRFKIIKDRVNGVCPDKDWLEFIAYLDKRVERENAVNGN